MEFEKLISDFADRHSVANLAADRNVRHDVSDHDSDIRLIQRGAVEVSYIAILMNNLHENMITLSCAANAFNVADLASVLRYIIIDVVFYYLDLPPDSISVSSSSIVDESKLNSSIFFK